VRAIACLVTVCLAACAVEGSSSLQGGDDSKAVVDAVLAAKVQNGAVLTTTVDTNLRDGPRPTAQILRVVPAGSEVHIIGTSQSFQGFFSVTHDGIQGWMNGAYLTFVRGETIVVPEGWTVPTGVTTPVTAPLPVEEETLAPVVDEQPPPTNNETMLPSSRDDAMARAQTGVGYSYWWGGGRWDPAGSSVGGAGTCTGRCPSCTHAGRYGADCSGFVSKVWQVPAENSDPMISNHGYATVTFMNQAYSWSTIDRAALLPADALVHNENGSGHIVLYEKGDAWGSFWTYESRSCAIGIVHNLRSVTSNYKAIRRSGY